MVCIKQTKRRLLKDQKSMQSRHLIPQWSPRALQFLHWESWECHLVLLNLSASLLSAGLLVDAVWQ